mmetsp:Transcript_16290/g.65827  ORF Transcript_16290/g.65827 Transcript_16290/m.65827 type:complete len:132 (+) Transcript_16290:128-523(+)
MGKGSNVAKANAAREKNLKDKSKTPEERAAAKAKAEKDKAAHKCAVCLATFIISSTDAVLFKHIEAKHEKLVTEPEKCFPKLKGFCPTAAPAAGAAPAAAPVVKKKPAPAKKGDDVGDLLAAGLAGAKKKK